MRFDSADRTATCHRVLMALSPGRAHSSMCHCSRLTSSGAAQLSTLPQPQVTDPAACPAHISCLASVARCSCMSLETKVDDLLSGRSRPIAPLPNMARKAPSLAPARSIESRRCANAVICLCTSPTTSWQPPCPTFSSARAAEEASAPTTTRREREPLSTTHRAESESPPQKSGGRALRRHACGGSTTPAPGAPARRSGSS